jgi:hypothetical protein
MTENGIILNIEKPGDRNSFRVRKFSRSGSVSERGDSEVRLGDDEEAIAKLKRSIESEDEGETAKKNLVVQNHSLERPGFHQARFSQ